MLLKSKFHDYYDSCLGFGVDKKVVYERVAVTFNDRTENGKVSPTWAAIDRVLPIHGVLKENYYEPHYRSNSKEEEVFKVRLIGFCGKIYPVILLYGRKPVKDPFTWKTHDTYCIHNGSMLLEFSEKYPDHVMAKKLVKDFPKVNEYLTPREHLEPFLILDVPVFVKGPERVDLNPCLKDWNFGKVVGGVEAFQEISMFLSGVLGSKDKSPDMVGNDEDRARSKGFDKQSFRKRK